MEITITSRTDARAEFTVKVGEAELAHIKAEVYDYLRPRVKAAGFRPGKAPDMIVEREMGFNAIQGEVIDHALQHTYADAIRQENLPVVASPQVSIEKFVPYTELEYKVSVDLLPKPKLADYKKLRVKRPEVKVDEAKLERMLSDLRRRHAVKLETEEAAKQAADATKDAAKDAATATKEAAKDAADATKDAAKDAVAAAKDAAAATKEAGKEAVAATADAAKEAADKAKAAVGK